MSDGNEYPSRKTEDQAIEPLYDKETLNRLAIASCSAFFGLCSGVIMTLTAAPKINEAIMYTQESNKPKMLIINKTNDRKTILFQNRYKDGVYDIPIETHLQGFSEKSQRDNERERLENLVNDNTGDKNE